MLKQASIRMVSGNMPDTDRQLVDKLIESFESLLEDSTTEFPAKIVRAKLPGSIFIIRDPEKIVVAYAPKLGNEVAYIDHPQNVLPSHVARDLSMSRDIDDLSIAVLPRYLLGKLPEQQRVGLQPAVHDIVTRSVSAFQMANGISAFSPIFGPNKYPVQENLIFVLMPFQETLDKVYKSTVKPAVEDDLKLVCRRADEIKGNNPIMNDIWKSICEARIVIADLTGFNPNVMYELGIAHTLGKPSLLMYQDKDTSAKFPFDLAHIRRVNYEDSAAGGVRLRADIVSTLKTMLQFEA